MTRARTVWLALLALGLVVALLLRTPAKERNASENLESRRDAGQRRTSGESREFEVEVVDPAEAGIAFASASGAEEPANESELVTTLVVHSPSARRASLTSATSGMPVGGPLRYHTCSTALSSIA